MQPTNPRYLQNKQRENWEESITAILEFSIIALSHDLPVRESRGDHVTRKATDVKTT